MKPGHVSQRRFAALVGVSPTRIAQWIDDGRLPMARDKSIPLEKGKAAIRAMGRSIPGEAASASPAGDEPPPPPADEHDDTPTGNLTEDIRRAELKERRIRVRQRQLEYDRKAGRLVPVEEVRADAQRTAAAIRGRLLAIGARTALQIEALLQREPAARAAAIQALVEDEVNAALGELNGSRFAAGEEAAP